VTPRKFRNSSFNPQTRSNQNSGSKPERSPRVRTRSKSTNLTQSPANFVRGLHNAGYQTSYPTLVSGLLGGAGTLVTVSATATAAVSGSGSSLDFTYAGTGGIWGDPHMNDADGTSTMFTGCVTTPRSWYAALSDAGIQINFSCDWSTRWNAEAITDISIVIGNHVISTQSTQPTISGNNVENYNGVGWVGAVTIDGVTYNPGLGWTSYLGGMVQSDINDLTPGKEDNYVDITYVNGATTYNITITYDPDQNAALWITATKAGACGVPGGIWGATLAGVDDNNSVVGFQVASATATMPQFNWSTCAPQTAVSQTVHLTQ